MASCYYDVVGKKTSKIGNFVSSFQFVTFYSDWKDEIFCLIGIHRGIWVVQAIRNEKEIFTVFSKVVMSKTILDEENSFFEIYEAIKCPEKENY